MNVHNDTGQTDQQPPQADVGQTALLGQTPDFHSASHAMHSSSAALSPEDYRSHHYPDSDNGLSPEAEYGPSGSRKARGSGEDTVTARRREANRLAAQRFRSRKKGYQDSLEEKIRSLEQANRALQGRIGDYDGPVHEGSLGSLPTSGLRPHYDQFASWPGAVPSTKHMPSNPLSPVAGPLAPECHDVHQDHEFRIRHLEKVNAGLEEELREVREENKALRDEFRRWRMQEERVEDDVIRPGLARDAPPLEHHRSWSSRPSYPYPSPHSSLQSQSSGHSSVTGSDQSLYASQHSQHSQHGHRRSEDRYSSSLHLPPLRRVASPAGALSVPTPQIPLLKPRSPPRPDE
ncbi:hypothetical protein, variant [Cryptococcus amylolentus CBS 6039]|uniref:BZIP domain-containing protein n=1 Tax=Cryptococcus amylolentus CBS 6039 TaxID=1295533 RepID=A0A1E3HES3_9TREE|nr:hypothetical protein L202_07437 [Cryptococcus amylolentus CBS 6039]XP_018989793.1 hypothetical protein, variant [Cryptococcus amylolentus CBS 6039]ODN73930.1 hypothetical protein L202_07437 [Cryptococcus amylolentus CBS 6039]ODN73931.1 hypothetical protein, variant [Cryptococcus amylolentus CBS 6039]